MAADTSAAEEDLEDLDDVALGREVVDIFGEVRQP